MEVSVPLTLPATPYELADALDKIRLNDPRGSCSLESVDCELEYLPQFLNPNVNLYDLNYLAYRLYNLSEWELDCFEGMVMMDAVQTSYSPIAIERLINMTHSMEHCQIAHEAYDDTSLGKFYAENGFVPDLEPLSENVFAWLDYGKIGKEMREGEGGVFTPNGYVVQNGEIVQAYQSGDAIPAEKPDYVILLEVYKGCDNAPGCENSRLFRLKLPAGSETLEAMLKHLNAASVEECGWRCLDCRVPALTDTVSSCEDMREIIRFNTLLSGMDEKTVFKYKAVIGAAECTDLQTAKILATHLDQFMLDRKMGSAQELALAELAFLMGHKEVELLQSFVNLDGYGQALLARDNAVLTPYGHLVRDDYQPMQAPLDTPNQSGMEMK